MRKQSALNGVMLLLSIIGAVAAFLFGEALLIYVSYLPFWIQCGIYLLFVMSVCCLVMILSEKIRTGYYLLKHRREFGLTAGKAALIFLPAALAIGIITQILYSWGGISLNTNPRFQGTMIVCDVSGSMQENDPYMDTVESMVSYIETVPLDEHIGVILFNDMSYNLREYSPLESEEEREGLIQLIYDEMYYYGGTDIEGALLSAFAEMRELDDPSWPGLVLLFSDGLSDINYDRIRSASIGNASNSRNRIPVNTIYFSQSVLSGYQMNTIAEITGGQYYHLGVGGDPSELRNAFSKSRAEFNFQTDRHLIKSSTWSESNIIIRAVIRIVLLSAWGVFSGIFVVVFLNNNRLFKHFLVAKIVVSIICAIAFTIILQNMNTDFGSRIGRGLLAAGMCVMYLPTYRWD